MSATTEIVVPVCTIVAMDTSNFWYRACDTCERALMCSSEGQFYHCKYCSSRARFASSKRVYRLLLSVATESRVMVVICFDRLAKVLMGCTADELFDFAASNPFTVENVAKILEGQLFQVVLRNSKGGNAQHMRISSLVPLASDFMPVIKHLRKLYKSA